MTSKGRESQYARSLIEASLDPLVTINTGGKITDMNEALANITGLTRRKLTGTDFLDYFTEPQKAREVYQEVFARGSVADSPLTLRHKNGKLTDVLFNGSVYKDETGKVLGVVIVARDVTAQKLLSSYSLSLIEASLDPLVTISTKGKITDMNEATVKITGQSREKLRGSDFFKYFTEPLKARQVYQEVFAKGSVTDSPLTLKHRSGTLRDVLFNGSVYRDDRGNVLGVVIGARDVTDRNRIAKELLEAKTLAEKATGLAEEARNKAENATRIAEVAVQAKQQFLSNMSHEIRTPMNAIIGFTKVVLKTGLSGKQREYLEAIRQSGDSLVVLINDILDLAKVNAGKMSFENSPFSLRSAITSMLQLFKAKIQEKNIVLVTSYDARIPVILSGDAARLRQIMLNLMSNAVKFTLAGKITVSVELLSEDERTATVSFGVTDTGIGISKEKVENIFENFEQAYDVTSRLYGGTGLGLAIVKQLVEAQGGKVQLKSRPGKGSTFSFDLTFEKAENTVVPEAMTTEAHAKLNLNILVVEDMPLNQLLMKTLMDDFGFSSDIAGNGQIALEKMKTNAYDLILMDLQMPVMNGFAATDYIRNTMRSQIPIIALTADVATIDLPGCLAAGMNDYISKPVDDRLLYNMIVKLVVTGAQKIAPAAHTGFKYIDWEHLNSKTKSNPDFMMEMIRVYLKQTPPLLDVMKQNLEDSDWNSLHAVVHKMIPSFSIMGFQADVESIAKRIQEYAGARIHTDEIPGLVMQLEKACLQAFKESREEYEMLINRQK